MTFFHFNLLLFPIFIWTIISLFYLDFYTPFHFFFFFFSNFFILFQFFFNSFQFFFIFCYILFLFDPGHILDFFCLFIQDVGCITACSFLIFGKYKIVIWHIFWRNGKTFQDYSDLPNNYAANLNIFRQKNTYKTLLGPTCLLISEIFPSKPDFHLCT